jgi:RNase H-fold protein (predicted Holliday junction resolvase)
MLKLGLVFILLSMTSLAQAKDVSALQVGVEYARENMEKAEAEYKDNLQRVSDSEKRLADAQKILGDDRQKAATAKKNLEESRAKYEKAQQVLDQAWKQP